MLRRPLRGLNVVLWGGCLLATGIAHAAETYTVTELKEAPAGLSEAVQKVLPATGLRIADTKGTVCDLWLAKGVKSKPGFVPNLRVKYPFLSGTLVGAIRFPERPELTDFRGQAIKPGLYTLRSSLQPDDGNHLGTSEIRDFLVACPAKQDVNPQRIDKIKALFKLSAQAAGTTHPAIYLLRPPAESPFTAPAAIYDSEHKLVIFRANLTVQDGDKNVVVPLQLVTHGKSEG